MKTPNEFEEDLRRICEAEFIPWDILRGSTIFITGATGLIGFNLVNALLYANRVKQLNLSIILLIRNRQEAGKRFGEDCFETGILKCVVGNVENLPFIEDPVDYIIHGASLTTSRMFVEQPVEVISAAFAGTKNMLELARKKQVKGFAYLSTMEVYGYPERGHKVTEKSVGALSPLEVRNSYPLSKQLCENLCCAYAKEFDVPAVILRLTQTFGPGVKYNDSRVFAEFGRCILEQRDIVLKTEGKTERCYLYTSDAVTAILTVLSRGTSGQAYNVADGRTYCSIADMAQIAAKLGGVCVRYQVGNRVSSGYAQTLYMDLDTTKIEELGWMPREDIEGIVTLYQRMILYMK